MRRVRFARMTMAAVAVIAMLVAILLLSGCSGQVPQKRTGLHDVIPSVVGMSLPQARQALVRSGYGLGSVRPRTTSSKARVIAQSPVAGTAAARGARVDVMLK